ncbi:MAG: universal stress protein [Pseudomonadota bacterium]|nr:universal stress protein [Pseudomonadota bacterium]
MFKKVLLCYDGSEPGRRALKRGAELAILVGAEVHVLSIVRDDVLSAAVMATAAGHTCLVDEERAYQKLLDDSVERLTARGVKAKGYLAHGNTIQQIAAYAQKLAVDLIVIGHYPSPEGRRWWSGPERASLAERVNCCIFVAVNADSDPSVASSPPAQ